MELLNLWQEFTKTGRIEDYVKYVSQKEEVTIEDDNIADIHKGTYH